MTVNYCRIIYSLLIALVVTSSAADGLPPPVTHRLTRVPVATYDVGDTARLTCHLGSSFPRPQLTWRVRDAANENSGRTLPDRSRIESGQTVLVLPTLRVSDSGLYTCTATNLLGSIEASVRIIVKERAELPRRIIRLAAVAPAALGVTLDCVSPPGDPTAGSAPAVAVWSRERGDLPKGRHVQLANSSLRLQRLRSNDSGSYLCEAAMHSGERVTLLYDLQVQRLIPSFHNRPPQLGLPSTSQSSYLSLHLIGLPYLRHDIEVAFRARRGLGLILYSGTGLPGTDFLSLSLVDWFLVYRFNLGSGSVLLRSRQPVSPGVWTIAGLSRVGRTGRLTVTAAEASAIDDRNNGSDSRPVEKSTPGDRQGLGLPKVFYLGCAPAPLIGRLAVQLGAAETVCFDGDVSRLAVEGRPIIVGDNAARDSARIGGEVTQAVVCSINGTSGPCLNGGTCRPEHEATGYQCLCPGDYTGRRCEKWRERCAPTTCGSHGRCREVADGIQCDCGLGLSGDRCQNGHPIKVPHFTGRGKASVSYLAVANQPNPSGSLVTLSVRPDDSSSGLLMFSGDLVALGGDFQSLSMKNGRLLAQVRISGQLHQLQSDRPLPAGAWTRVAFRRSLTELSLSLNQSETSARLSLSANDSRLLPKIAGHIYLAGLSDDVIAAVGDVIAGEGGYRGCLKNLELMASKVELADAAVEHSGVGDCAQTLGCRSALCESATCRDTIDDSRRLQRQMVCECPDDRSGRFCERRATPCDRTVCLNAGRCIGLSRDRHLCHCRLGFTGLHCQITSMLHQSARFHGNGYIELRGDYLSSSVSFEFHIEFWLRVNNSTASASLILWHGQPSDELPDGQDFISVSVNRQGRLRLDCSFAADTSRHLATLESSPHSPRIDDGLGRRFRLLARRLSAEQNDRHQLQIYVEDSLTASAMLPALASSRRQGNIYIGGLPVDSALSSSISPSSSSSSSTHQLLGGFQGCLWSLRMQNSAPVNFLVESLSGFNAVPCQL